MTDSQRLYPSRGLTVSPGGRPYPKTQAPKPHRKFGMWSLDYTRGSKTQNLGRVSKNSISMYIHHSCRYRHCADGVLSFANTYNQVADIASTTSEIITRWAQSATRNFDDIVVALVDLEWSRLNRPVFSTKEDGHQ